MGVMVAQIYGKLIAFPVLCEESRSLTGDPGGMGRRFLPPIMVTGEQLVSG